MRNTGCFVDVFCIKINFLLWVYIKKKKVEKALDYLAWHIQKSTLKNSFNLQAKVIYFSSKYVSVFTTFKSKI